MGYPDVVFNFLDQNIIKKIKISEKIHEHIVSGFLAVVKYEKSYVLVPSIIAQKIEQRSSDCVIPFKNESTLLPKEDDPYSEYQIPDDLIW
jgi:uncharacterized protein YaiL (DUF2058 family)